MFQALSRPGDRIVGGVGKALHPPGLTIWAMVRLFIGREAINKGTCTWSQREGHTMKRNEQGGLETWRKGRESRDLAAPAALLAGLPALELVCPLESSPR